MQVPVAHLGRLKLFTLILIGYLMYFTNEDILL